MQVPYPRKGYQGGGFLSSIVSGIGKAGKAIGKSATSEFGNGKGGANWGNIASTGMNAMQSGIKGYGSGFGMGMSESTLGKVGYGMMGAQGAMNNAYGVGQGINTYQDQMEQEREEAAKQQALIGQQMGQEETYPGGGLVVNQYGGRNYIQGGYYDDYGFFIEEEPLPNTLADMQASANPNGWGHMSEENDRRRNSNLMGRMHRQSNVDATPVISPSERGGPTPKKRRGFVMGGRLRYSSPLNRKSLTLSIQKWA